MTLFHSFEQPSKEVSVEKSFKTDEEDGPKPKPAETKKVNHYKPVSTVSHVIMLADLDKNKFFRLDCRENDMTLQKPCRFFVLFFTTKPDIIHSQLPLKWLCKAFVRETDVIWEERQRMTTCVYPPSPPLFPFINCFACNLGRIGYGWLIIARCTAGGMRRPIRLSDKQTGTGHPE